MRLNLAALKLLRKEMNTNEFYQCERKKDLVFYHFFSHYVCKYAYFAHSMYDLFLLRLSCLLRDCIGRIEKERRNVSLPAFKNINCFK